MKPNKLSVLSGTECENIIETALSIIDDTGVLVTLPEAGDLLTGAGGRKGEEGRICFTPEQMQGFIKSAPRSFRLYDRRGGSFEIAPGQSRTFCGGTVAMVADRPDGTLRKATRDDVAKFTSLCDALPNVSCVVPMVEAQDIPAEQVEIVTFAETITNTTKYTFVCPVKHESARRWVEMVRIATGTDDLATKPMAGLMATVLPNLHLDDDCAATTILAAREGMPLLCMAGAIAGSSSPNTIAGSVAVKLAGELFQVALAQIVRQGTPVFIDTGAMTLDMKTADLGLAGPENDLGVIAFARIGAALELPTYSCSLHTEAKTGDFQTGMEKMAGAMSARLSGIDLTTNMGLISRSNAASYEQLVIDDEMCAFVNRFVAGVTVNDDTLAMDVIREVGPGGDYLGHPHTMKHCLSGEIWYPGLLDRTSAGSEPVDLYARAKEKVKDILDSHKPDITDELKQKIGEIIL